VLPVVHTATEMPVDIVFAGPGLEEVFLARRRRLVRGGTSIPVASPEDLVVMKILAGRPRDDDDVGSILRAMPTLDMGHVEKTLVLLERALGQSDLLPRLAELRGRAARGRTAPAKPSPKQAPPSRRTKRTASTKRAAKTKSARRKPKSGR